jgi:hypothetical protein
VFHGKPLACASRTGLHFIGDEQDAVLVAHGAQVLQQGRGRHVEAAFALYRLDDDGGHTARFHVVLEQRFERVDGVLHAHAMQFVGEACMEDLGREGAKTRLVRSHLAGQAQRHHRAPVVTAGKGNHPRAAGVGACDLHGVFHRLGAGGQKQRLLGEVARRLGVQAFGQLYVGLVRQHLEAGVRVAVELVLHGLHHGGVAVAGVQDGNAAGKVDVALALNVPDLAVLGAVDEDLVRMAHAARNSGFTARIEGGIAGQGVAVHGYPLVCKSCCHCRSRPAPLTYTDSPRSPLHCAVQLACTDKPLVVPVLPAIPCSL